MYRLTVRLYLSLSAAFLWGCALTEGPAERADSLARDAGLRRLDSGPHGLRTYVRASGGPKMVVYIEGDGAPWRRPDEPPADPTPLRHFVLQMAIADPSSQVVYLGRKCQYLPEAELSGCDPDLWMLGRFRLDAVAASNQAINVIKEQLAASRVSLVGYSGGGAMAALVAAHRTDVDCLVTLAAPLDSQAWTAAIQVTPLRNSLNPVDFANRLRGTAQTHFRGLRDRVVPSASTRRFFQAIPGANVIDLEEFDHDCCWESAWSRLRRMSCLAD